MNRISHRVWIVYVFLLVLLFGLAFYIAEYSSSGEKWVLHKGSPHVYDGGNLGCGVVTDRDGLLLLDMTHGRTYSKDPQVRVSFLHWLGDRQGAIYAPILRNYARELAGFDLINGLYWYDGIGGRAELTLSSAIQTVANNALGDYKGTIAVYNYRTGEILCAVTTPSYDPDVPPNPDTAPEGIYVNRFTQSLYVPGSIFKLVTAAAALEHDPDILEKTYTCTGRLAFDTGRVTCEKFHGEVNLQQALTLSCNCAFAQIAIQLGEEELDTYARQFQITQPLQLDGISCVAGGLEILGQTDAELAWSAIGQHRDQINPARFLTFLGAIASGGQGAQPYLVQEISSSNQVQYRAKTQFGERILSAQTAAQLQQMMRRNVVEGYGAEHFPGLTVCAKTGTSQLGGDQLPNAMFAGFVLDEKYPFAFFVAVENAGYGRTVCVPMMAQVLAACKEMVDNG